MIRLHSMGTRSHLSGYKPAFKCIFTVYCRSCWHSLSLSPAITCWCIRHNEMVINWHTLFKCYILGQTSNRRRKAPLPLCLMYNLPVKLASMQSSGVILFSILCAPPPLIDLLCPVSTACRPKICRLKILGRIKSGGRNNEAA